MKCAMNCNLRQLWLLILTGICALKSCVKVLVDDGDSFARRTSSTAAAWAALRAAQAELVLSQNEIGA